MNKTTLEIQNELNELAARRDALEEQLTRANGECDEAMRAEQKQHLIALAQQGQSCLLEYERERTDLNEAMTQAGARLRNAFTKLVKTRWRFEQIFNELAPGNSLINFPSQVSKAQEYQEQVENLVAEIEAGGVVLQSVRYPWLPSRIVNLLDDERAWQRERLSYNEAIDLVELIHDRLHQQTDDAA